MQYFPPVNGDQEDPNRPYINAVAGIIEGSWPHAKAIEGSMREILAVISGAGLTPNGEDFTQLLEAIQQLIEDALPSADNVFIARDEKAVSVSGGTFTSGADRVRDINQVKRNTISGASLASNRITLPVGTYEILAFCPAYQVDGHQALLYNVTASTELIVGTSNYAQVGQSGMSHSIVTGAIALAAPSELELRHRCQTTASTSGMGSSQGWRTPNVYSTFFARKIG
jgi:hypothetical protein